MKYYLSPRVLERSSDLSVRVIHAKSVRNRVSSEPEIESLRREEALLRSEMTLESLKMEPSIRSYRDFLQLCGINPNRFPASIEAMLKRILKGGSLPLLNRVVDECNRISLHEKISLGAHDLREMKEDLCIDFSDGSERFLPMGETEWEFLEAGELLFKSGSIVQTRRWIWRQSEIGKTTRETEEIFFHLVGFQSVSLDRASESILNLVQELGGNARLFTVDRHQPEIFF